MRQAELDHVMRRAAGHYVSTDAKSTATWRVAMLLDAGAAAASADANGWTALHEAARAGAPDATLALLLRRGAAIDARTATGDTALELAQRHRHVGTSRLLRVWAETGAPPDGPNGVLEPLLGPALRDEL
jgi:hypothetical protein